MSGWPGWRTAPDAGSAEDRTPGSGSPFPAPGPPPGWYPRSCQKNWPLLPRRRRIGRGAGRRREGRRKIVSYTNLSQGKDRGIFFPSRGGEKLDHSRHAAPGIPLDPVGPEDVQAAGGTGVTDGDMVRVQAGQLQPAAVCPLQVHLVLPRP